MTRRGVLAAAILTYAVAWFLPVIKEGHTLADGVLPGWEAFMVALGPLIEREDWSSPVHAVLHVLSALTNVVFLGATVALVRRREKYAKVASKTLFACALLNLYWLYFPIFDEGTLLPGYYAWVISFGMLGAAARSAD